MTGVIKEHMRKWDFAPILSFMINKKKMMLYIIYVNFKWLVFL